MTRGRWLAVGGVLVVLALALAVVRSLGGSGRAGSVAVDVPVHDPPAAFAQSPAVALPQRADADPLPIVLRGLDAVIGTSDGLEVLDTRTGDVRRTVPALAGGSTASAAPSFWAPPPGRSPGAPGSPSPEATGAVELTGSVAALPQLVSVAGRAVVAAAFPASVAGRGTRVSHPAVQVLAVDAASYDPVARARVDLPASLSDADRLRDVQVVGADGGVLVVVARRGADAVPTTIALDPVTGRVAWQRAGFAAATLVAHRVAGVQSPGGSQDGVRVAALTVEDGAPAWSGAGPAARSAQVWAAGPARVAVTATEAGTGGRTLALLDAVTGTARTSRAADGEVTCRFDERSVTVCGRGESGQAWAAGFDAATGRQLWELPDAAAGRVAPQVSTAWHGVVYGRTENGPVALDARTGADRAVLPGVAPDLVNGYVGIAAATLGTPHPMAYRASS